MELPIDAQTQQNLVTAIIGIMVMLGLNLLTNVGKFLFDMFKKKTEQGDSQLIQVQSALQQNTITVNQLKGQIDSLESDLKEIRKYRHDTQKLFYAIKTMAGKRWPEIRKAMEDDVFTKP